MRFFFLWLLQPLLPCSVPLALHLEIDAAQKPAFFGWLRDARGIYAHVQLQSAPFPAWAWIRSAIGPAVSMHIQALRRALRYEDEVLVQPKKQDAHSISVVLHINAIFRLRLKVFYSYMRDF